MTCSTTRHKSFRGFARGEQEAAIKRPRRSLRVHSRSRCRTLPRARIRLAERPHERRPRARCSRICFSSSAPKRRRLRIPRRHHQLPVLRLRPRLHPHFPLHFLARLTMCHALLPTAGCACARSRRPSARLTPLSVPAPRNATLESCRSGASARRTMSVAPRISTTAILVGGTST